MFRVLGMYNFGMGQNNKAVAICLNPRVPIVIHSEFLSFYKIGRGASSAGTVLTNQSKLVGCQTLCIYCKGV